VSHFRQKATVLRQELWCTSASCAGCSGSASSPSRERSSSPLRLARRNAPGPECGRAETLSRRSHSRCRSGGSCSWRCQLDPGHPDRHARHRRELNKPPSPSASPPSPARPAADSSSQPEQPDNATATCSRRSRPAGSTRTRASSTQTRPVEASSRPPKSRPVNETQ
jgi:hypothetical protein